MSTIPKKKTSGKDAAAAAAEVEVLLNDLGQALLAPSPFGVGGFPPPHPRMLRCPLPLHLLLQVRL
jgi:hypothetical protein